MCFLRQRGLFIGIRVEGDSHLFIREHGVPDTRKGVFMYKKLSFALTFISFLMLISCATNGKNTWKNITSIDKMLGEWEGIQYLSTTPDSPMLEMPITICVSKDNNQNYLIETIYDFNKILDFYIDKIIDLTKDELWEMLISSDNISDYINTEGNSGTFLEKYFVREIITLSFEERDTFDLNDYQINQRGDRLKMFFGDTMSESIAAQEEVILQRR